MYFFFLFILVLFFRFVSFVLRLSCFLILIQYLQVVYHSHIECPSIGLQIKLRGFLSHIEQLRIGYWGITSTKTQSMSHGLASPRSPTDENQQPAEASVVGRSWVQSMFSKDTTSKSNSFSRVRRWTSDSGSTGIFFFLWLYACFTGFYF